MSTAIDFPAAMFDPVMGDPALAVPRADVAYLIWTLVKKRGNVICYPYSVSRGDPASIMSTTMVQVDCRAANMARAFQVADEVDRRIQSMPYEDFDDVIVASADPVDGPRWQPDENGGPRYVARYAVAHHPRQGRRHV